MGLSPVARFTTIAIKAIQNLRLAANALLEYLASSCTARQYIGAKGNRSDSDNGLYISLVERANKKYRTFEHFKRHPHYTAVLEHVSREQGQKYLDVISRQSPELVSRIAEFKINDRVGDPITFSYAEIGRISPTTLRYIKVASDLVRIFKDLNGANISEIGVGYGGQLLVLDQIIRMKSYCLFDLPPVLELASRYLESHLLRTAYKKTTLNQCDGEEAFDLVISNYAFSELPSHIQTMYAKKVIAKSRRGYLTMNSGTGGVLDSAGNKLKINQLRDIFPAFDIIEEEPLTAPGNYIIVWDHVNCPGS
jgi:putative sugar O-methyltransferase